MSVINNQWLEEVAVWIDDHQGMSWIPKRAEELLDQQDYEKLAEFMDEIDKEVATDIRRSQEHFYNTNQIEATDTF